MNATHAEPPAITLLGAPTSAPTEPHLGTGHPAVPPVPGVVRRACRLVALGTEWLFGGFALLVGLAILAATPVLQFLTLGYLLEAEGRVARSGRLRDGLIGVRRAARVGSLAIGCWLMLLPVRVVSTLTTSAQIIDPAGPIARRWTLALAILTTLMLVHIATACARGGKFRYFFWPLNLFWLVRRIRHGGFYASSRDAVWRFVETLRLPYYFRLGFLGFAGTLAWLFIPVSLIAAGRRAPVLLPFGALLLGIVTALLPFLQARYASEGRWAALFETRAVRDRFRRAPWAFAVASLLTLVSAIPLYLLKIEMIPHETVWLPSLLFLIFMFPARLATGWAYHRSECRMRPRHWFFRGTTRLAILPIVAFYVLIVYFTQFTAWQGIWSLYEQHAFLVPAPFLNF